MLVSSAVPAVSSVGAAGAAPQGAVGSSARQGHSNSDRQGRGITIYYLLQSYETKCPQPPPTEFFYGSS